MHGLLSSSCNAQVDLARIILKNGLILDKLVIFRDENNDGQSLEDNLLTEAKFSEISQKLQAFPRASEQASSYLVYHPVKRLEARSMCPAATPAKVVETKTTRKKQNLKR